jgi:hypothetical protein
MKVRSLSIIVIAWLAFEPLIAWSTGCSGALSSLLRQHVTGQYLYEQLQTPSYNKTFNELFNGQRNLEPWLKVYLKTCDGVDTPGETRNVGGGIYKLYSICKPHNSVGNCLYVVFEPGGAHAWAIFTKDDGTSRLFGNPGTEMQSVLRSAASE